jgi:two-component system, OmpR family, KDP operon response regulator KdpE
LTRVLVVDDEPSILRPLRINLTARNYQVSTASDGTSGLAVMARERPDVMILDLGLPDMDGTDVIRGVRAGLRRRSSCCRSGDTKARRSRRSTRARTTM